MWTAKALSNDQVVAGKKVLESLPKSFLELTLNYLNTERKLKTKQNH
jgi:hypothetical protein